METRGYFLLSSMILALQNSLRGDRKKIAKYKEYR